MKKLLLITFVFCTYISNAQSPQLSVKGNDSAMVTMSQLLINVKIIGNIAYSIAEMHFYNKGKKQMEAELSFPLQEGVSVSRYAIDINGKIREAVPVNKNKGKQVFEAIEHRRVDPGLLEKTEGNNFKTRIYPINPNAERIVIIGYEETLPFFDKRNLAYRFLSKYPQKLEKFEVNITVSANTTNPTITDENNDNENIKWTASNQTFIRKINYQPSEKWLVKIPVQQNVAGVVMQKVDDQFYFYINTNIEDQKIKKNIPASIGIIWDNSLSCKNKDLQKELALLDAYFTSIGNTTVTLYLMNYTFSKNESFVIKNGNWQQLKTKLENTIFDGGTRYSQIKYCVHDEYLFFTDGLSSLSSNTMPPAEKPVYTISSLVSSDYGFLNYYAQQSGASFINLVQLDVSTALYKLTNQSMRFLGIKENNLVSEMYPTKGTPVSGGFNITGISLKADNKIVLLFGYGKNAVIEKTVKLDALKKGANDVSIEKIWAQKKIEALEMQYTKNAEEIEMTGKRYGIATQNTSLIVLENISDYIAYDIIPPPELRMEYDKILKEQRQTRIAEQKSNWNNVDDYFNELMSWWKKDIHYTTPKQKKVITKSNVPFINTSMSPVSDTIHFFTKSSSQSNDDKSLQEVVVTAMGTQRQTRNLGYSSVTVSPVTIKPQMENALQGKVAGIQISTSVSTISPSIIIRGNSSLSASNNPMIIVDGKLFNGNLNEIKTDDISSTTILKDAAATSIYGAAGANGAIVITTKNGKYQTETAEEIKIASWNPDRVYLKSLKAVAPEKRYAVYLELRETQLNNPNFYYDVANYFYDNNEKERAFLILSNIADLSLENHQLYKTLTYTLNQWGVFDDALFTASQVVKWREHEPQSHRDLALTLENNKQYQQAFDALIKALTVNYFKEMDGQYEGIEDIILMDMNRIVSAYPSIKTGKLSKKYFARRPVDVRVILNWNQMDVDIDLHVIEPNKEECYYGHTTTVAGGRFSKDFTEGYGPEQYLLRNAIKGKYLIKTDYFGERTLTENGPATVMIEIYTTKNGITKKKIQTLQLENIKENQVLAELNID